ncbi:MAG TPA: hypothetical protein PLC04_01235 [Candidatus Kapabacteria bacterium]|nr:hypothetical protein [Candidatus Kapabacteria bacterium]
MKFFPYYFIFCLLALDLNSQIIPEISKTLMDFGNLPECKVGYDTVVIRNPSNSPVIFKLLAGEYIEGPSCFKIINPKIKDLDLPPYDGTNAVIYVVKFDASIAQEGNNIGKLIIPTDLQNYPFIEISLSGLKFSSRYDFTNLDFGTIGVGTQSVANLILHISSKSPTKISNISNSHPELSPDLSNFNYTISSRDTIISIKYTITLPNALNFRDTIMIHIAEPCDTVLKIPVSAVSIESTVNYLSTIDFGRLSQCEIKDTTIAFNYNGLSEAKINSIGAISGNDNFASMFSASFSQNLPILLNKVNSSANLRIQYMGDKALEGVFSINIPINATIDGKDYRLDISVSGIVEGYHISIDKNSYNFGLNIVNTPVLTNFTIRNVGTTVVDFINYKFINDPTNSLSLATPFAPFSLGSNDNYYFDVVFNPQFNNIQLDGSLIIYYQFRECQDSIVISLKGQSFSKKQIDFELKAGTYFPNNYSVNIPVYLISKDGFTGNNERIVMSISFLRDLYYPESVSSINNAQIISNKISNNYRILKIEITLPDIDVGDSLPHLLFDINGSILLGEHTESPISIDSIEFAHPEIFEVGNIKNDTLYIQVCNAGGERLLKNVNADFGLVQPPQIENDEVEFVIQTLEKGNYNIQIYDYLGNKIREIEFTGEKASIYEFNLKMNGYPFSLYFYTITSPTQSIKGKFIRID